MKPKQKEQTRMSSLYQKFATSTAAEVDEGVTLDYGSLGSLRIRRAGGANKSYRQMMDAKLKPYTRQIQTDTMDDDLARAINVEVFAKTVLIGWDGIVGRDGKPLPFSVENAIMLFTDLPDFFADVFRAANDRSLFLAGGDEAALGN